MAEDKVHVDPKRLRDFAEQLSSTIAAYKNGIERLESRLAHLSKTWRDQQFDDFRKEVRDTRRILEEFIAEASTARRNIIADAEKAEAYHRINPR